jgi:hypothetical protein
MADTEIRTADGINDYKADESSRKMVTRSLSLLKGWKIATFLQSARCPVVKQPNLAAPHSELVGGGHKYDKMSLKMFK